MKVPKSSIYTRKRCEAEVKFGGTQQVTAYSGLLVFAKLFEGVGLSRRTAEACGPDGSRHYSKGAVFRWLIVHVLLGFSKLRDSETYRDDPLVLRALGLERLPSVPTVSRVLRGFGEGDVARLGKLSGDIVLGRLGLEGRSAVTLDFDGTVLSTSRHAEGSAVGFNRKKKGQRSYYPLLCVVAQTGQVLDVLHRSGNVHDSNGAPAFVAECVRRVREAAPGARVEARLDGAFFSDGIVGLLEKLGVEYTISVPFERFAELKRHVEGRKFWWPTAAGQSHFERRWRPKSWSACRRFLYVRTEAAVQRKGPLQLDLFEPTDTSHEYKVVVTNKSTSAKKTIRFHDGRGSQEGVYAQLKTGCAMGYVPARSWVANKVFLLANVYAHNLSRELQMQTWEPQRATTEKRAARWVFETLGTLRKRLIARPAKITRPQGKLTLTVPKDPLLESYFADYLTT